MRKWVYQALYEVIVNGCYSNLYLKNHLHEIDEKDQALATTIFYGTIQNLKYCEYGWNQYCQKKVNKKVGIILSMSVYQMKFLDKIPDYAIINEAVSICKELSKGASGFVNAILHKVAKNEITLPEDEIKRISIQYSMDEWLIRMWSKQYGKECAFEMARASNQIMPVIVRWNQMIPFEENKELEELEYPLFIYKGVNLSRCDLYLQGKISAQDEGSYRISQLLDVQKGQSVLDCCAAPGTKTMALAEAMNNTGHIDSLDLHEHRCKLIENDARRLHLNIVSAHCQDSCDLHAYGLYDRVLCDVPCSGYGVLSRKPDIKLHLKPEDMDTLIPLQYCLLCEGSRHVKEDGILVYSTCTVNKKENEKQVLRFLKEHENFILESENTIFPSVKKDGFYMAKLVYKKAQ